MLIRSQVIPGQEYDVTAPLRPQSGIDKIKLLLNTAYVTPLFEQAIATNNPFTLEPANNKICLEKRGIYYLVILNQEYFDFNQDILTQINDGILQLVQNGFLIPTEQSMCGVALYYIAHISEVEFYFDNIRKNLWVIQTKASNRIDKAKQQDLFFRYTDNNDSLTQTYYSNDYVPGTDNKHPIPSTVTIYDKEQRDIVTMVNRRGVTKQQQLERISNHPWKTRLEFRLSRDNHGKFLNIQNFSGTYEDILERYKELLSILYNRFCDGKVMYTNDTNYYLQKVVNKASKTKHILRFTNKDGKLIL